MKLCLGFIGMDCVISELCYNRGIILQRNYGKNDHLWPFSYNSFVKVHGTAFESHMRVLNPKSVLY